jgi:AmmeMemoRadiSam system protein B
MLNKKLLQTLIITLAFVLPTFIFYRYSNKNVKGVQTEQEELGKAKGVILPHHGFAKEILIGSYEQLKKDGYDLIVIIGPNHFYPEIKELVTSDTEAGIKTSEEITQKLLEKNENIIVDNDLVLGEHSIMLQAQYIEEFFPEAKVLPIIVPPTLEAEDMDNIANTLTELADNTLFIASVDFAHDLPYPEAIENDKESIEAIRVFDYQKISVFDDKNMDSPKSISLLMNIMQKLNAKKFTVLYDTHGALISNDPDLIGTSYVVGIFTE